MGFNIVESGAGGAKDVGVYDADRQRIPPPQRRSWMLPLLALLVVALLFGAFLLLFRGRAPTTPRVGTSGAPKVEAPVVRAPEMPSIKTPKVMKEKKEEEPVGQTTTTGAAIAQPDELAIHFTGNGALPDRFALPGINFKFGSTEMTEGGGDVDGNATIDRLAALMKEHPTAKLRLEGHTDSMGTSEVNAPLSWQRAATVHQMLVDRGVDASRIEVVGKREAEPVAPNDTSEGRAENRRIDAVILSR